jgi:membrane-bound serine protease (ClpP class)
MRNGHNPDIGEAFMTKEKEVKIGDRVVHPKGSLLTLSAQEATEKINGKPLLADGIADSVEDLARKAELKGQLVPFDPSGFERLASWITELAPLLLLLGIVCAYLEFKIPGASLPGIIAAFCFALFFLGHYLAGLAGWEVVALFVLGVVLVLIEVLFFAHSTIVFGVVGVFLMLGSLLWAMVDRYPDQPVIPSTKMLLVPIPIQVVASEEKSVLEQQDAVALRMPRRRNGQETGSQFPRLNAIKDDLRTRLRQQFIPVNDASALEMLSVALLL